MATEGLSGPIYKVHQVPEHFHELFIMGGYRHPKSTAKQCVLSVFDPTNETLNFWTHFLPSLYFIWVLRDLTETLDFRNDSFTWPLLMYMFACCIFPLASATAHTFNTMSYHARHICFFLDYAALSLFSLGAALAYKAYVFPHCLQDTFLDSYFVQIAFINSILGTTISCETRFMNPSFFRKILRIGAFAWPYIFDCIPIIMRLLYCDSTECKLASQLNHGRQFAFAVIAAFLYISHIPERLQPGKFDIIGHSHQLFHISSILGVHDQMQGILLDMQYHQTRKSEVMEDWDFHDINSSLGIMGTVFFLNILIITAFSIRLRCTALKDRQD
ncbi:hypothetical protein FSP39_018838 [Pinctada imbricata]|uniref:Membrane progestin receptor gamma n=1 Tax=Pinctada imbricata TaxID=66713 RepID=A0AA88YJF9_PINIB|nr:hypothetical protein FSP39_018838 [Pinctada imbricata]